VKNLTIFDRLLSPKAILPIACGTALLLRHMKGAARLAMAAGIGVGIEETLKRTISRRRPGRHAVARRRSFPSGHSAGSTAYLVSLAMMMPKPWSRAVGLVLAGAAVAAVDTIRVREREHWISDVLAGDVVGILAVAAAHGVVRLGASAKGKYRPGPSSTNANRDRRPMSAANHYPPT
jgi:membrane-associated phospholipid phosphatase